MARHVQKFDFNTLGINLSYKVILALLMGMIKHFQGIQSNKFATSLHYLQKVYGCISFFLHAGKHHSFFKLALLFWWKWPDMPKVPKRGSW